MNSKNYAIKNALKELKKIKINCFIVKLNVLSNHLLKLFLIKIVQIFAELMIGKMEYVNQIMKMKTQMPN